MVVGITVITKTKVLIFAKIGNCGPLLMIKMKKGKATVSSGHSVFGDVGRQLRIEVQFQ